MKKKSNSLFKTIVVILIIEIILSFFLTQEINIGTNPETNKFGFWTEESHETLQTKIKKDFQTDEFFREEGITPTILGSENLYHSFLKIFGNNAFGTFMLLRMLFIVDIIMLLLAFFVKKSINNEKPGKVQILFESIYSFFEEIVTDTLGKQNIHFTPYILTIFLFIWVSNLIGMIPIPGFMEPTRNLNVPFGLGVMAIIVVHFTAIRHKGFINHFENFVNPIKNPLFLLDIVGEMSKVVSIAFRLFGNVLGGAIIILVVSSLVKYVMLPVLLNGFFGIFVGTIQAFVFTMLSLTYIAVEISE
ncbi:MAG: F0F1 ATP synthase subunit A [Candidatus Cloacimonadota bacterium]|nr:F0F1 ATP synthase subunit A [Candidatus Cloacimonadota bacterium]